MLRRAFAVLAIAVMGSLGAPANSSAQYDPGYVVPHGETLGSWMYTGCYEDFFCTYAKIWLAQDRNTDQPGYEVLAYTFGWQASDEYLLRTSYWNPALVFYADYLGLCDPGTGSGISSFPRNSSEFSNYCEFYPWRPSPSPIDVIPTTWEIFAAEDPLAENRLGSVSLELTPVPEPTGLGLLVVGLFGVIAVALRRRSVEPCQ